MILIIKIFYLALVLQYLQGCKLLLVLNHANFAVLIQIVQVLIFPNFKKILGNKIRLSNVEVSNPVTTTTANGYSIS